MVSYGMVWYGMVWYGILWYGIVCSMSVSESTSALLLSLNWSSMFSLLILPAP